MFAKNFDGKVALITGASSGIGAAMAREFSARRGQVALVARRRDRITELASTLTAAGAKALPFAADVTQIEELSQAAKAAAQQLGRIDVVVANAGFGVVGFAERLTVDDYRRQFETNVFGVLNTLYATLPYLKDSRGSFVIIGSVTGYLSLPGNSAYSMSKFAVRSLAEALRNELSVHGISVTHVAPGFVQSEIRTVDNRGNFRPKGKDPIPLWLQMPTDKAARKIVRTVLCRRRELVLTQHGKLIVFLQRHFSWLTYLLIAAFGVRGRREPAVGK
jgi:short-subunit dehydrogenase